MAYNEETKAQAKSLYALGDSFDTIAAKMNIGATTVENWAKAGTWIKGEIKDKIYKSFEDEILQTAKEQGVTITRYFQKIAEFLEAQKVTFSKDVDSEGNPVQGSEDAIDVPDYRTQIEGAKLIRDTFGLNIKREQIKVNHQIEPIIIKSADGKDMMRLDTQSGEE